MGVEHSATRCRGWILTRNDGGVLGFTDHDHALVLDGVVLDPATGFTPSAWAESVGLDRSDMDIDGALSSDAIRADALTAGLYDGAQVDFYWIDWTGVELPQLMSVARIAEVVRSQNSFTATMEGLGARANEPRGLLMSRRCGLEFGGVVNAVTGRGCGLDLADPALSVVTTVSAVSSQRIFETTDSSFVAGWCDGGRVIWQTGVNQGHRHFIRSHKVTGGDTLLEIDRTPLGSVVVGDEFKLVAGCNHAKIRCREFGNFARFGGFTMPNDSVATKYQRRAPK